MSEMDHIVLGSDRAFDNDPLHPVFSLLRNKNINIVSQDGKALDSSFDVVVFSTAIERTNPEDEKVMSLNIPFRTRPQFSIELAEKFRTIAVACTSGKTTISGMIAYMMDSLGIEPNFIGGGDEEF